VRFKLVKNATGDADVDVGWSVCCQAEWRQQPVWSRLEAIYHHRERLVER